MKLAGRNAIITGASQGLGAAIAEHFIAEGATVALCARTSADLDAVRHRLHTEYPSATIFARPTDIADQHQVDRFFDESMAALGRIDILVNNAGVYGPMGSLDTIDWQHWIDALAINLLGTVYCARKAVSLFKPNHYGKIVNISGGGATTPLPGLSAYAAAKAAVVRFTETLALETRDWRIDVNAVAPGALATRLTDELIAAGPHRVGASFHARMTKLKAEGGTPLQLGAKLCVYLGSAESDGLTGRLIAAQWDPWPFSEAIKGDIADTDIYTLRRIIPQERGKTWGDR
jgi:NAD(P)-dependent dehydrogenase (short-subunit alcohol dehydrogenase family)